MKISLSKSNRHVSWLLLLIILLPFGSLLTGCSGSSNTSSSDPNQMAPMADMPAGIQKAPVSVSNSYRFAVANPDPLKNVPCYCGCGAAGHTSNYSCYVKEVKPSGEVVFDLHALGCSICVDITQDVMKMTRDGKPPKEIRAAIDQTYCTVRPVQHGRRSNNGGEITIRPFGRKSSFRALGLDHLRNHVRAADPFRSPAATQRSSHRPAYPHRSQYVSVCPGRDSD